MQKIMAIFLIVLGAASLFFAYFSYQQTHQFTSALVIRTLIVAIVLLVFGFKTVFASDGHH